MPYKPIEDYGIIGDMHTAALIGKDASIDWLCLPDFDSPSVFASILDSEKGGYFKIAATKPDRLKQLYLPDTNVLVTRFLSREGVGEVVDFMPVSGRDSDSGRRRIVRRVTAVRGGVHFRLECFPSFNYARSSHRVEISGHSVHFISDELHLELFSPETLEQKDGGVVGEFYLEPGETRVFMLQHVEEGRIYVSPDPNADQGFLDTIHFWHRWVAQCNYQGRWREMVIRSALVLKLLTYQPTGAIIAAPTCSLPESIGGRRNWDYRYTWIRDASFTIYSFLRIGFTEEAHHFMEFLENRLRELTAGDTLQLMYRINGGRDLTEDILEHLDGYQHSRPVRIGNGAYDQLQLDIYGALLDAIYLYDKYARPVPYDLWENIRRIVNWVSVNWQQPDEGIWEVRGGRQNFVYSRVMCWVALDRGIRLADKRSYPAERNRWIKVRDHIYLDIIRHGWDPVRKAFTQYYGSDSLDASNLLMPLVLFMSARDPRMTSMIDATIEELVSDSLVYRYHVDQGASDGFTENEGTFSICTFWLSECLSRAGRLDESRLIFEKMLGYANHVGLYSEEIGPSGEALGNFPQAFTHLGLISAAFELNKALDSTGNGMESSFR